MAKAAVGLPFPYYLELLVRFHALIYSYAIELISFIVGSIDLASLIFSITLLIGYFQKYPRTCSTEGRRYPSELRPRLGPIRCHGTLYFYMAQTLCFPRRRCDMHISSHDEMACDLVDKK